MKLVVILAAGFLLSISAYSLAFQSSSESYSSNRTAVTSGGLYASATNSSFSSVSQAAAGILNSSETRAYIGIFAESGLAVEYLSSSSSAVSVSGSAADLILRFSNSDGPVSGVSGKIWAEKAPGVYDSGRLCTSNSTGHCLVSFAPDCSYTGGTARVTGGTFSDDRYSDINITPSSLLIDTSVGCADSVSFSMEFSVDSSNDAVAGIGRKGRGFYGNSETFGCIQGNATSSKPSLGIVYAGKTLKSVNLTSKGSVEFVEMTQSSTGNRFVIPVTQGSCDTVASRVSSISSVNQPFVSFGEQAESPLELSVIYDSIDIVGSFEVSGARTLSIKKTTQEKIQFEVPGS